MEHNRTLSSDVSTDKPTLASSLDNANTDLIVSEALTVVSDPVDASLVDDGDTEAGKELSTPDASLAADAPEDALIAFPGAVVTADVASDVPVVTSVPPGEDSLGAASRIADVEAPTFVRDCTVSLELLTSSPRDELASSPRVAPRGDASCIVSASSVISSPVFIDKGHIKDVIASTPESAISSVTVMSRDSVFNASNVNNDNFIVEPSALGAGAPVSAVEDVVVTPGAVPGSPLPPRLLSDQSAAALSAPAAPCAVTHEPAPGVLRSGPRAAGGSCRGMSVPPGGPPLVETGRALSEPLSLLGAAVLAGPAENLTVEPDIPTVLTGGELDDCIIMEDLDAGPSSTPTPMEEFPPLSSTSLYLRTAAPTKRKARGSSVSPSGSSPRSGRSASCGDSIPRRKKISGRKCRRNVILSDEDDKCNDFSVVRDTNPSSSTVVTSLPDKLDVVANSDSKPKPAPGIKTRSGKRLLKRIEPEDEISLDDVSAVFDEDLDIDLMNSSVASLGSQLLEWLSAVEERRRKSRNIQGPISGQMKGYLWRSMEAVNTIIGKFSACDTSFFRMRIKELTLGLRSAEEANRRLTLELQELRSSLSTVPPAVAAGIPAFPPSPRNDPVSFPPLPPRFRPPLPGPSHKPSPPGPFLSSDFPPLPLSPSPVECPSTPPPQKQNSNSKLKIPNYTYLDARAVFSPPPPRPSSGCPDFPVPSSGSSLPVSDPDSLPAAENFLARAKNFHALKAAALTELEEMSALVESLAGHFRKPAPSSTSNPPPLPPPSSLPPLKPPPKPKPKSKPTIVLDVTSPPIVESYSLPSAADPNIKEKWVRALGRRDKKKRIKSDGTGDGSPLLPSEGLPSSLLPMPSTPAPPAKAVHRHPTPRKRTRPAAVLVTGFSENLSCAAFLKLAREKVSLRDLGIENTRIKKAASGGLIIEVLGPGGTEKADSLVKELNRVVTDVKVRRPIKKAELKIFGLDDSASSEEITMILSDLTSVKTEDIRVSQVRKMANGLGMAWVALPYNAAIDVANQGHLRIGWTSARVEFLPSRPVQCYKCWQFGHTKFTCKNNIDRSNCCFKCGTSGHSAQSCISPLMCVLCKDNGFAANHRIGSDICRTAFPSDGLERVRRPESQTLDNGS